ncbi:N4-gp56 family major capsid protein [Macrococcus sp. FSL R5-0951]
MVQGMTKQENVIKAEVLAPIIHAKLEAKLKFAEFAERDFSLQGGQGDTIAFPAYKYIGDAQVIEEGAEIPIEKLEKTQRSATIHKIAKGMEVTDEAQLRGIGNTVDVAIEQIALALANGEDNAVVEEVKKATLTFNGSPTSLDSINGAIDLFDDEDMEDMVLFVSHKDIGALRKAAALDWTRESELGDNLIVKGVVGELFGALVVRSKKVPKGEAYLAKKGAVKLIAKRAPLIETERYASRKTTGIFGDLHFAAFLYDESKVVKITSAGA